MEFDLRQLPLYVISLVTETKRREHISNEFKSRGLTPIFFDGIKASPGRVGCALSHLAVVKKELTEREGNRPFVIFEDDISFTDVYDPIVKVPDGTDAVYLGVSTFGHDSLYHNRGGPRCFRINEKYARVTGMLSAHCILFIDKEFMRAACIAPEYAIQQNTNRDVIMAYMQRFFMVLTLISPICYQNSEYEGQERPTKDTLHRFLKSSEVYTDYVERDYIYHPKPRPFNFPKHTIITMILQPQNTTKNTNVTYLRNGYNLLLVNSPMIIFCSGNYIEFVQKTRAKFGYSEQTTIIEYIPDQKESILIKVKENIAKKKNINRGNDSNVYNSAEYVTLFYRKSKKIQEAILNNPYKSKYFTWVDFGLSYVCPFYQIGLTKKLKTAISTNPDKLHVQVVAGINQSVVLKTEDVYWRTFQDAIAGGLLSGSGKSFLQMYEHFDKTVLECLQQGYYPLEQAIFGKIAMDQPEMFKFWFGDYQQILFNWGNLSSNINYLINTIMIKSRLDAEKTKLYTKSLGWLIAKETARELIKSHETRIITLNNDQLLTVFTESFLAEWYSENDSKQRHLNCYQIGSKIVKEYGRNKNFLKNVKQKASNINGNLGLVGLNIDLKKEEIHVMEPLLGDEEKRLYYKYLDRATNYLEFGSGGSTYQACECKNIKKIYTIESDEQWVEKLITNPTIKNAIDKIEILLIDLQAESNNWGYPGKNTNHGDWVKYPSVVEKINMKIVDLVMVDGRFRSACALHCFSKISDSTVIIFDDFWNRKWYHVVLDFYYVVERKGRMAILKKKNVPNPSSELLFQYEKDSR
jgi:hypothetical protein